MDIDLQKDILSYLSVTYPQTVLIKLKKQKSKKKNTCPGELTASDIRHRLWLPR